jgi:glucose-6-phosphate-specific signal transduction histidine kinase
MNPSGELETMHPSLNASAKTWGRHIAIAIAYAIGLFLCRQVIIPHFVLLSGVRVLVLILTPYRYWPALIVGEESVLVPMSIACWSQFGVVWSLINLVPATALTAPFVYVARKRGPLLERKGHVHVGVLLMCALVVSIVCTAYNLLMASVTIVPADFPTIHYDQWAAEWLLGNFLGILTVAPIALAIHQGWKEHGWKGLFQHAGESRIVFESACLTVPLLALLLWIGFTMPHVRGVAQICLFLPVVWLALRHGWQGASIGGTLASVAVIVLMPEQFDHNTLQAEVVVAFAISTMLLVGARIGVLNRHAEQERADVRVALELARNNILVGEMQLRATSQALEQIRETVRSGFTMMLGRLRHLQPAIDDGSYQRIALVAQDQIYRLADGLHPLTWRERGLPAALREGAIARMLDEAGIRYQCDLRGPLSGLSSNLHLVIYRMIGEAVSEGCRKQDISDVAVRVRGGEASGRRWVAVSLVFRRQPAHLSQVKWNELLPRLGRTASGVGIKALNHRAAAFEGWAREREFSDGRRISWLMLDP